MDLNNGKAQWLLKDAEGKYLSSRTMHWKVDCVSESYVESAPILDQNGKVMAFVIGGASDSATGSFNQRAMLMASAPELYAALKKLTEIAELTIGWMGTPVDADGPLIQARAALAMVDGETT